MEEKIREILELAIHAPSGDNAQPWKFTIKNQEIYLYNLREADVTLYNFRHRGDFVAHGAVLENIVLTAAHEGYQTQLALFPDPTNPNLVAIVSLEKSQPQTDPLYPGILKRATNRKPYKTIPLTAQQRDALISAFKNFDGARLILLEDKEKIVSLARILSLNERLILENYYIHKGLFSYIRWTKQDEEKYRTGLYIKTLELKPLQEFAFKMFRKWPVIKLLGKLGIPKLVAKDSAKLYAASAGYGLIVVENESDQAFVLAGRMLQRIWLTITMLGLSLQPTVALLYLAQRINAGETKEFSSKQVDLIKDADTRIRQIFGLTKGVPVMLFRIGHSDPPSAKSLKRWSNIAPL